ncbi:MAG: GGDEF domain-containing protein [Actinomycetota bacterium]|nr:GGDEF domain-containing protein [Actinomycetota bacterium]
MSKQRLLLVAGLGVTIALALGAWLVEGWGGGSATRAADDVGLLAFAVFATVCSFRAAARARARQRGTWLALAGGLAAWSAGEVVWCYYELWQGLPQTPFPSPADAAYLLFPVGAAVALLMFPTGKTHQSRSRLVLDGLIVTGSLFLVSWVSVLNSVYQAGASSTFALSVSMAYPLADLVLITMTVMVLARAHTAQRLTLGLLSAGILLMSFSDSVFAYLTATDPYHTGNLIDLGWVTAFLLFGLAALSSTHHQASVTNSAQLPSRSRLWLPYLPVVLACAVGARQAVPLLKSGPVPAVAVLLVVVLLIRQFVTMADNRRLLITVAHQAFHDPLTGLANRALFNDRLERAVQLQRRDLRPLAVLMLDLDDFKAVNDRFGHPAGDELLVRVAERLVGCLRVSDTIARLGGDEFAVLIEHDTDAAIRAAQRVQEAFSIPFRVDLHPLTVTPSIGLATAPAHALDVSAERLLKQADLAMYQAKRNGTAAVSLFPNTRTARPGPDQLTPRPT